MAEPERNMAVPGLALEDRDATESESGAYTPPFCTPVRPYRYSDHVHQDRHIFLKGASIGLGCGGGPDNKRSLEEEATSLPPPVQNTDTAGRFHPHAGPQNLCLPNLQPLQLPLSVQTGGHDSYSPGATGTNRRKHAVEGVQCHSSSSRRPFNEHLNTYVDTQKRIRAVQFLEDLYRPPPFHTFPYLSTPPAKPSRPPPRPVRSVMPAPLLPCRTSANTPPFSLSRHHTTLSRSSSILSPSMTSSSIGNRGCSSTQSLRRSAASLQSALKMSEAERELLNARNTLKRDQHRSSSRSYIDYFLAKGAQEGRLGRLFESYPKRELVNVHPGRLRRHRTQMDFPSRVKILK